MAGMKNQIGATQRWSSIFRHSLALLIFICGSKIVRAQQWPASGSQPPSSSGFLPAASIQPLPAEGKFKLAAEDSFDPYAYLLAGMFAEVGQAQHDPKSWGQGWGSFAKRYVASFADQTDENMMTEAVLPVLLKEDPRYFRLGQGSFFKRTTYAMSRIWVTRLDAGGQTFNYSEIAGAAASSAISNLYYPSEDRTLSKNLSRWGIFVGGDTFFNLLKEYWPDIHHKIFGR
jgi:hypothetical protein